MEAYRFTGFRAGNAMFTYKMMFLLQVFCCFSLISKKKWDSLNMMCFKKRWNVFGMYFFCFWLVMYLIDGEYLHML